MSKGIAEHVISGDVSLTFSSNRACFSICRSELITLKIMVMEFEQRPAFFACV